MELETVIYLTKHHHLRPHRGADDGCLVPERPPRITPLLDDRRVGDARGKHLIRGATLNA